VAGSCDVDHLQIVFLDETIEVRVDKIESGGGAPMPEQSGLHMLNLQRLPQQGIRIQVDLAHGKIVRGTPIGVDLAQFF
jgi:hypothetical protein